MEVDLASEFRYRQPPLMKRGGFLFVSQSGETADTLAALRYAKEGGQYCLSIVNVLNSSIARELSKLHDITWVNSIGLRSPKFNKNDLFRMIKKGWALVCPDKWIRPDNGVKPAQSVECCDPLEKRPPKDWQPTVIHPLALPFHGTRLVRWLNQKLLRQRIFSRRQDLKNKDTILWVSLSSAANMLGKMNDCFSIYYCGDDFSALAGVDHEVMAKLEAELVNEVDLIVVASEALAQKFPAEKTLYVPHGVAEYFYEAPCGINSRDGEPVRPADLPSSGPIAGFYGSISSWLDQPLLLSAAKQLPHWQFVLIGKVCCDVSLLKGQSNIHFLGEKSHQQLPEYVHHWQVSLLPFLDNEQIRACNPSKLREYLACGKPVVATDFPALEPYRQCVHVVEQQAFVLPAVNEQQRAKQFAEYIVRAAADLPVVDDLVLNKAGLSFVDVVSSWQDVDRMRTNTQHRMAQVHKQSWRNRALTIYNEVQRRMALV